MQWFEGRGGTVGLMALAGVALYASSRTAARLLAGPDTTARPGVRAVGHWLPVAGTSVVALLLGRPEIATTVAFATSVASLSFVLGVLNYLVPMGDLPASRRAWPFVLPAALIAIVAGFSGHLTWVHALAMTVLGVAIVAAWREISAADSAGASPLADGGEIERYRWAAAVEFALVVALAGIGGWAAVTGAVRTAAASRFVPTSVVTIAVLTPLLVLPMMNAPPPDKARGYTASMASTLVALSLLNLCALLPVLTILWFVKTGLSSPAGTAAADTNIHASYFVTAALRGKPLPFPLVSWRVDAVVLAVLGFAMIPVSLGRWTFGRWESFGLVVGYAVYLIVVAIVSVGA